MTTANQRHAQQEWLVYQSREPLLVIQTRVRESQIAKTRRRPVEQRVDTELLREAVQLTAGSTSLREVNEVCLDPTLGEKPQGLPCFCALSYPKDLHF